MNLASRARKKTYIVNRDFQFRYTLAAAVVGLVSTILTAVVILYPLYIFEILRIPRFLPTPFLLAMCLAAILNIGLIVMMGIILTHRIAGPMFSLVRSFRRVEQGLYSVPMRVRTDDEMRYVVRNFNEMLEGLQKQTRDDLEVLDRMAQAVASSGNTALITDVAALKTRLDERLRLPTQP